MQIWCFLTLPARVVRPLQKAEATTIDMTKAEPMAAGGGGAVPGVALFQLLAPPAVITPKMQLPKWMFPPGQVPAPIPPPAHETSAQLGMRILARGTSNGGPMYMQDNDLYYTNYFGAYCEPPLIQWLYTLPNGKQLHDLIKARPYEGTLVLKWDILHDTRYAFGEERRAEVVVHLVGIKRVGMPLEFNTTAPQLVIKMPLNYHMMNYKAQRPACLKALPVSLVPGL